MRSGSNATARSSGPGGRPARSAAACAARWSTATAAAWSPGCGATRGLHAHHIRHWEDGGPTELDNLVLLCPFHHRLHHSGGITITGPAAHLVVTDADGNTLDPGSLARPPTTTADQR